MKIIIVNGSARKGNTLSAIDAFVEGASEKNEIEIIQPDKIHIAPCKGGGACQCYIRKKPHWQKKRTENRTCCGINHKSLS